MSSNSKMQKKYRVTLRFIFKFKKYLEVVKWANHGVSSRVSLIKNKSDEIIWKENEARKSVLEICMGMTLIH